MNQAELDRAVFRLANDYVPTMKGVTPDIIATHLSPCPPPNSLADAYLTLLISGQSPNMKPSVIGKAIGGVDKLGPLLGGFDPRAVCKRYGSDFQRLLDDIETQLQPRGKIRRGARSIWPHFCMTVLSGAAFLSEFKDWQDFDRWAMEFDNPRTRVALPMLLSHEVEGFGFPLACDFLKELGYEGYLKPDVHIKTIFGELGLCDRPDDYAMFKAGVRLAANAGVSPARVDKLLWGIASGKFPRSKVEVDGQREEFILHVRQTLQLPRP